MDAADAKLKHGSLRYSGEGHAKPAGSFALSRAGRASMSDRDPAGADALREAPSKGSGPTSSTVAVLLSGRAPVAGFCLLRFQ
jgi:hypothetical protein